MKTAAMVVALCVICLERAKSARFEVRARPLTHISSSHTHAHMRVHARTVHTRSYAHIRTHTCTHSVHTRALARRTHVSHAAIYVAARNANRIWTCVRCVANPS